MCSRTKLKDEGLVERPTRAFEDHRRSPAATGTSVSHRDFEVSHDISLRPHANKKKQLPVPYDKYTASSHVAETQQLKSCPIRHQHRPESFDSMHLFCSLDNNSVRPLRSHLWRWTCRLELGIQSLHRDVYLVARAAGKSEKPTEVHNGKAELLLVGIGEGQEDESRYVQSLSPNLHGSND